MTVYNFSMYSVVTDQQTVSRRMGTRQGIKNIGANIIEGTGVE